MATVINLNDTTPAAVTGSQNVKWQADTSDPINVSAYIQPPTTSLIGGVKAIAAVAHKWINSIGTTGAPTLTQPDFADLTVTPSTARSTLGAAASGANGDITSLTAVGAGGIASSGAITGTLGAWQTSATPTVTGTGAMTISGLTVASAKFLKVGPITFFYYDISFTTAGTAGVGVLVTPPTTCAGGVQAVTAVNAQTLTLVSGYFFTTAAISVVNPAAANWTLGAQHLYLSGSYQNA